MPFPLSRWKLNYHFFNNPAFFQFSKSLLAVDLQLSEVSYVHMQGDVTHNMYRIPAVYQRIFNQLIQVLH